MAGSVKGSLTVVIWLQGAITTPCARGLKQPWQVNDATILVTIAMTCAAPTGNGSFVTLDGSLPLTTVDHHGTH